MDNFISIRSKETTSAIVCKKSSPFGELFSQYCMSRGIQRDDVYFTYLDKIILDTDTAASLGICDSKEIKVFKK